MSLTIKSGSCEATFLYSGEQKDLWLRSVHRVLVNKKLQTNEFPYTIIETEDKYLATLTKTGVHAVKDRVKAPEFYVSLEEILQHISQNEWDKVEIEKRYFKDSVCKLWSFIIQDQVLQFEREVYGLLLQNDNGGLTVESVLVRLLQNGKLCSFVDLRRALEHLCILGVAERNHGQFSVRYGLIENEVVKS